MLLRTEFLPAQPGLMAEIVKKEHFGWKAPVQPSSGNRVQRALSCRSKILRALGEKLWSQQLLWC